MTELKAPMPYFGGKSKVAPLIWQKLGVVKHYIEPFAGSLAVLLANPSPPTYETVNDRDHYLANFWRALKADPQGVERCSDYPVIEVDLHTRHAWLRAQAEFRARMEADPDYYDVKIAGWWVWGISTWIGDRWCDPGSPQYHRFAIASSKGQNAQGKVPLSVLAERLRKTRVMCGDWKRAVTPVLLSFGQSTCGVLLDPPYPEGDMRYVGEEQNTAQLFSEVVVWCRENQDNPNLRIVLCGYEGTADLPGWTEIAWKAHGGFGNRSEENPNAHRERIWVSPSCPQAKQPSLF